MVLVYLVVVVTIQEILSKRAVAKLLETAGQFSLGLPEGTAQFGYPTFLCNPCILLHNPCFV